MAIVIGKRSELEVKVKIAEWNKGGDSAMTDWPSEVIASGTFLP